MKEKFLGINYYSYKSNNMKKYDKKVFSSHSQKIKLFVVIDKLLHTHLYTFTRSLK